jgi:hypothetical protein
LTRCVNGLYAETAWLKPGRWEWLKTENQTIHAAMMELAQILTVECEAIGPRPVTDSSLTSKWQQYLPWMFKLLKDTPEGERRFNIMPEHGFTPIFVTIDVKVLHALYKMICKDTPKLETFLEQSDMWWNRAFAVNKVTTGRYQFKGTVKTDGVSVCVPMARISFESSILSEGEIPEQSRQSRQSRHFDDPAPTHIIGLIFRKSWT